MPKVTPQVAAEEWESGLTRATARITRGVQAVTENPATKAIASLDKMRDGFLAAIDDGRVQRGLERVTLASWKSDMVEKGIPRIAAGARAARGKMQDAFSRIFPVQEELERQIEGMADLTIEDSMARIRVQIEGMHAAKVAGRF